MFFRCDELFFATERLWKEVAFAARLRFTSNVDDREYRERRAAKMRHAQAFDAVKREIRQKMADAVLRAPDFAIPYGLDALVNKKAPWQQWSREAWHSLLLSGNPKTIAALLVDPADGHEEALADSHPFAGLADALRARH